MDRPKGERNIFLNVFPLVTLERKNLMQLALLLKINSLINGTYIPKEKRESFTVTIEETKKYVVEVKASGRDEAVKVALGLQKLGIVKEKPELALRSVDVSRTSESVVAKMKANAQVTRERVRNRFARIPQDRDNILGYSSPLWERFLCDCEEDDYPRRPELSQDTGRQYISDAPVLSQEEIDTLLSGVISTAEN